MGRSLCRSKGKECGTTRTMPPQQLQHQHGLRCPRLIRLQRATAEQSLELRRRRHIALRSSPPVAKLSKQGLRSWRQRELHMKSEVLDLCDWAQPLKIGLEQIATDRLCCVRLAAARPMDQNQSQAIAEFVLVYVNLYVVVTVLLRVRLGMWHGQPMLVCSSCIATASFSMCHQVQQQGNLDAAHYIKKRGAYSEQQGRDATVCTKRDALRWVIGRTG